MTLEEIIAHCEKAIADDSEVAFKLRGGRGKGDRIKLRNVPGAPLGQIVARLPGGIALVMFDPKEVLAWAKGLIEEADATF